MKKNNKGFMLIELIITSTIVVTAMVTLYASFNRIYSLYKTRNNYYNINGVYATKEMVRILLEKNELAKIINDNFESGNYSFIIKDNNCQITNQACEEIKNFYGIENMILTSYSKYILSSSNVQNSSESNIEEPSSPAAAVTNESNESTEGEDNSEETPEPEPQPTVPDKVLKDEIKNETFKEYLEYITKYYNTSSNESYSYIVLTELKENNKYYYSNLGIR